MDSSGLKEVTAEEFEEFLHSWEFLAKPNEAPLTPRVKVDDLLAWVKDPEDLVMLGVFMLCGKGES
jgi:hypothetical protein